MKQRKGGRGADTKEWTLRYANTKAWDMRF
jgi:hypothetical protein